MTLPRLGYTPQGEAADCKSVAEKHAWFDSKVTHQNPNAAGLRHFKAIMPLRFMQRRTRWGGRQAFILEMAGSIPARCTKICAGSSEAEQGTLNLKVVGSNPTRHTKICVNSQMVKARATACRGFESLSSTTV